jgi:hypothetical protein
MRRSPGSSLLILLRPLLELLKNKQEFKQFSSGETAGKKAANLLNSFLAHAIF